MRIKNTKIYTVTADGWGDIITPEGTFPSIRYYEAALNVDSTWGKIFGSWILLNNTSDSSHTYNWWTNDSNIGVPLLTLVYDKTLGETTSIQWYSSTPPCLNPDLASNDLTFSAFTESSLTLNWANGNGGDRIVLAQENTSIDDIPENANNYSASSVYGTPGTELGNSFVVYNGNGNTVSVTGLNATTTYHFAIYEYSCTPEKYLTMALSGSETTTTPVGVNNLSSKENQILVYPNPVSQGQSIMFSNQTNVRVINSKGEEIMKAKNITKIDTSTMASGFYIILTENNQSIKVVVE
ncbi:MAG: T9SS type A sorting domain-containing protein [Bacteroidetes bacterium]|nr:T9SS type A sorting domain-containing protein [Bacteroidota bacterium]HET6244709.1 T9SS type A sorting domain-containing protein [Bacteroidia bacterium]